MDSVANGDGEREGSNVNTAFRLYVPSWQDPEGLTFTERLYADHLRTHRFTSYADLIALLGYEGGATPANDSTTVRAHICNLRRKTGIELRAVRRKGYVNEGAPVPEPVTPCVHYWLLPSPTGSTLVGRCRKCGSEKTFKASPNDDDWHYNRQAGAVAS